MLSNKRYNNGLRAHGLQFEKSRNPNPEYTYLFLQEEYRTELALEEMGVTNEDDPSMLPFMETPVEGPESIESLRIPFTIEIAGMQNAGKTTMLNRYLHELWLRNERNKFGVVSDSGILIREEQGDLRFQDPLAYSQLLGAVLTGQYQQQMYNLKHGMRIVVADRGHIDRRAFRRALFLRGDIDPWVIENEHRYMYDFENPMIQMGAIINFLERPSVSMERAGKEGPYTNMEFLPVLYDQYRRLHYEVLTDKIPCRFYRAINAEEDEERVYAQFKQIMDGLLNIHALYEFMLAQRFPEIYDQVMADRAVNPPRNETLEELSTLFGKNVWVVGGDEMDSIDEILDKPFIEGLDISTK